MNLDATYRSKLALFFASQPVKKAYLFGSQARHEAISGSDIDILVELDFQTPIGLAFFQMQFDLEELLNSKVDLVSTDALSEYVRPYVDRDKLLIYERIS